MPITRATNLAGLGTIFDSLTDGGGLSVSGISTFIDLNITRVNITGVGTISNGSITNLTGTAGTVTTLRSTTGNFTTGNIVTGVTTNFTSTNSSITNLTGTSSTITTLRSTTGNFTTGNIVTGVTTNFNATNVVITGVTTVSAGTALLPSISPSGDPNTGVFFPSADTISASTGGTARITIDSSGRLLVGTTTAIPTPFPGIFQVNYGGGYTADFGRFTNDVFGGFINFVHGRGGSPGVRGIVQNGDVLGLLEFVGDDGATLNYSAGNIRCEVDGTPGANHMPGRIMFSTNPGSPATFPTSSPPAMTIKSSQEVLIGTSTITANGGILQLKSGITFPATAVAASNANTLDDYEEGTWTPTITGWSGTHSVQNGTYTKVGRQVFLHCEVLTNGGSGTFTLNFPGIANLPFSTKAGIRHYGNWAGIGAGFVVPANSVGAGQWDQTSATSLFPNLFRTNGDLGNYDSANAASTFGYRSFISYCID